MIKSKKILALGGLVVVVLMAVFFSGSEGQNIKTQVSGEQQESKATEALRSLVDTADRASTGVPDIQSTQPFNFEIISSDGKFSNFGILHYVDEVKAESLIEEHAILFQEKGTVESNIAEVDRDTNKVVSMHRKIQYSDYQSSKEEIEKIVRQFLKETGNDPDIFLSEYGTKLEFSVQSKGGDEDFKRGNYFFRWDVKGIVLPKGVEMEVSPYVQVGITANGYIFSFENTIQLYNNLPKDLIHTI